MVRRVLEACVGFAAGRPAHLPWVLRRQPAICFLYTGAAGLLIFFTAGTVLLRICARHKLCLPLRRSRFCSWLATLPRCFHVARVLCSPALRACPAALHMAALINGSGHVSPNLCTICFRRLGCGGAAGRRRRAAFAAPGLRVSVYCCYLPAAAPPASLEKGEMEKERRVVSWRRAATNICLRHACAPCADAWRAPGGKRQVNLRQRGGEGDGERAHATRASARRRRAPPRSALPSRRTRCRFHLPLPLPRALLPALTPPPLRYCLSSCWAAADAAHLR